MTDYETSDPFASAINRANARMTFNAMEHKCDSVRSSGWLNRASFGSHRVSPPTRDCFPGFAKLFDMTRDQVAAMAAESWYGIRIEDISERVKRIAPALDALNEADAELVERLVARLNAETAAAQSSDHDQDVADVA